MSGGGAPDAGAGAGRRAVVTGATGIAAATARGLAASGWRVFVASIDPDECAALAAELGASSAGVTVADLRVEADVVRAFDDAAASMGGIDGVVAVAGGSARRLGDGWLHEMTVDGWDAAIRLNLTTTFLTAREAVRRMRGHGGSIVLTSSVLATSPQPESFTTHGYAAAKAAIAGWVVPLAAAYARDGIRINCVAPGLVDTPGAARAAGSPGDPGVRVAEAARRGRPPARGARRRGNGVGAGGARPHRPGDPGRRRLERRVDVLTAGARPRATSPRGVILQWNVADPTAAFRHRGGSCRH